MGEFIIHPKGYHHLGQGAKGEAYRFPEEVDAIGGGVVAIDEAAFDRAEGDRLLASPLGVLDLFLSLRAAGGRCVTVPDVLVTDTFSLLSGSLITRQEHEAFVARWGFDWRAPDLEAVKQRHAGTGLLWNIRFFGQTMPFAKYEQRRCMHWKSYAEVEVYRQRADCLTGAVLQVTPTCSPPATVLDLGCGDGLFTHLLALGGAKSIGLDPEPSAVQQAAERVAEEAARGSYPGPVPQFLAGCGESLPLEPASAHTVAMLDVIEHLPNPVAVLREVERVLAPAGHLVISTPAWQYGGWSDPIYHVCEYSISELAQQIQAATQLKACNTARIGDPYRDVIVMARKDPGSGQ
jgi:2-polyprenyl-3-methyl-5-hydroxy-6-metoxy-1,4-benzoquinol methylase